MHQCIAYVQSLTRMAVKQAFSALMKSLQCERQLLHCVIPDCGGIFVPLDEVLTSMFYQLFLVLR